MRLVFVLMIALAPWLAACGGADSAMRQDPNYRLGYGDGCSTANSRVRGGHNKVYRNDTLFKESKPYQFGWRDGYTSCGDRQNPDGFGLEY